MTESLRQKCELFERNCTVIAKKFILEKAVMNIAAGLIFTCADKEADTEKLKECRVMLNKHTCFFSEYREAVKLALVSEMALADDAEQYIEDVKSAYQKLNKGHFKDNSFMVLAAMILCELARQNDADAVIRKHNELMNQMEMLHPILTDSEDISYVMLLALSDRPVELILSDMNECFEYLKKSCKIKAGSDAVQRLSEILALTDGDIKEKCDAVIRLYEALQQNKAAIGDGFVFSSLGMLIAIEEVPENIVSEMIEAYEYLKDCKEFGNESEGQKYRLLVAELLVAYSYGTGTLMISNALINNALSIIKAQKIATMINLIANAAAAVLGAVADKDSTDSNSDDTAQTAPGTEANAVS